MPATQVQDNPIILPENAPAQTPDAEPDRADNTGGEAVVRTAAGNPHLPFLDGLRGLAALQVLLFHFIGLELHQQARPLRVLLAWTQFGHFAVDVFIVLSGFCLMLPVARAGTGRLNVPLPLYFKRRAWRILPPYYAALLLSLLIQGAAVPQSPVTPGNVVAHLLLVHNLFPAYHSSLNVALWSVATEWQIYFVFPFLLLPVWRRWGNGAAVAVGFVAGLLPRVLVPNGQWDGACPWYIGLFAMGMAGAAFTTAWRGKAWAGAARLPWMALLFACAYVLAKFAQPEATTTSVNIQWLKDAFGGAAAWCLIVHGALHSGRGGSRNRLLRLLEWRPLLTLGAFSYSLYLTHGIVLVGAQALFTHAHFTPFAQLLLMSGVGMPLAIAGAYGFYRFVEKPSMARRLVAARTGGK